MVVELTVSLKQDIKKRLSALKNEADLKSFEIEFLGRREGKITRLMHSLKNLPEKDRVRIGREANALKRHVESELREKKSVFEKKHLETLLKKEKLDISLPGRKKLLGHLHPITHVRRAAEAIFSSLGFEVIAGPEVESEYYNFDALNIPEDHPARDLWDTFWLATHPGLLLRTHTSPVQVRYMEKHNPPFRVIAPGKVFRYEATDASHDVEFTQLEGLMVGSDISVANLKDILLTFFRKMLSREAEIRLRPSYFPFVEPGFEVDLRTKGGGWLEIAGAGMVHQNVFSKAGYIKGQWQGFAFGVGLDRIAIAKYKIPDIRLLHSSDIRFLKQF